MFAKQRANISRKMVNPRLLAIHFHTFRHWKATIEYHRTRDILYVMQLLGHRSIKNTLVYTQLIGFREDEHVSKAVQTKDEAKQLVEGGFDYVCITPENVMLFRKRK